LKRFLVKAFFTSGIFYRLERLGVLISCFPKQLIQPSLKCAWDKMGSVLELLLMPIAVERSKYPRLTNTSATLPLTAS
jgi:hypothetical protein